MNSDIVLEVCLDSVASCQAAEQGGARRVELCANLADGGTTPGPGLIEAARKSIGIALHVMIRPRPGGFCYSHAEFDIMKREIALAKKLGANGVVFGVLKNDGTVDEERTLALTALARPMSVTFHRAFDVARDPLDSFEALIRIGIDRLLTSGQAATAPEGLELIGTLVTKAAGQIVVMPGCGITAENALSVVHSTGAREIHAGSGVSGSTSPETSSPVVSAEKVARMLRVVNSAR